MKISLKKIVALGVLHGLAFSLGVSSAAAYSTSGYKWSGTSTTYYIQSAFASSFKTAMKAADAEWDGSGSKFRFNYGGTTTRNPNVWSWNYPLGMSGGNDTYSDIGYYNAGASGHVATTQTWSTGTTLEEVDTTLNTYYGFTTTGTSGSYDVQNIVTHEFGHWLRLLDVSSTSSPDYCNSSSESTMCQSPMSVEDTNMRSLRTDDKNGIKAIYGV